MKITGLKASGFMGLHLVDVEVDNAPGAIEVHGKNGHGKSRFLDIIGAAVGGRKYTNHIKDAISAGKKRAKIEVKTSDGYTITRGWSKSGSSLHIEHDDEGVLARPADWLKQIVGEISFDPMGFANMQPREQKAYLMELCGLESELANIEEHKRAILDKKAQATKQRDIEVGVLERMPAVNKADIIKGQKDPIDVAELRAKISGHDDELHRLKQTHNEAHLRRQAAQDKIEAIDEKIRDLEEERDRLADSSKEYLEREAQTKAQIEELQSTDTDALRDKLTKADAHNRAIEAATHEAAQRKKVRAADTEIEAAADALESLEEQRRDVLTGAEYPVEGLAFDDDGVLHNGIPLSQCSQAERLRVSMQIAMKKNPTLRVIRVNDAALLDEDGLAAMHELAQAEDFQVWLECVGGGEDRGILLHDGEVVSIDGKPLELAEA